MIQFQKKLYSPVAKYFQRIHTSVRRRSTC